jgi:hypothetical protein
MLEKQVLGSLEDESGKRRFMFSISEPKRDAKGGDYFCRVRMSGVPSVNEPVRIYGVDARQARQLARRFVRQMLAGKRVRDAKGRPVRI